MTITFAQAPAAALELVRENTLLDDNVVVFAQRRPTTLKPHPVYTTSIRNVLDHRMLSSSYLTAWQYIFVDGEEPSALAEVAANRQGRPEGLAFAANYSREYARRTLKAMDAAHEFNGSAKSYELRVVRAPEIYLSAVWLHASDDDVLFPIEPVPVRVEANAPIHEEKLNAALLELAKQRGPR